MSTTDGPRVGRHPGKMPNGIKLATCVEELTGIFQQMPISDKDRATATFAGMSGIGAGMDFYNANDREPYVARWYLQDAANRAMIRALSAGRLPVWTDYDGGFVELDPEAMFGPNKWMDTHTVLTGNYVALNVAYGRDGPTRAECDGATLWVHNDHWPPVRAALIAERERESGAAFPADMAQLLFETGPPPSDALGYTAFGNNPFWSLYEAIAWLGSQDDTLVDRQDPRYFEGTSVRNYGAIAWLRLEKALADRIAANAGGITADEARRLLLAACKSAQVSATGIPADKSERCSIPVLEFVGSELWEGQGGSLHRKVGSKFEPARWFDIHFDADGVRAIAGGATTTSDADAKLPPVSTRELREWVAKRNQDGWSQDKIIKGAAAAFPENEVPGRPTLRKLDAAVRFELKLPKRERGRDKKGE